jgi:hypothetical protein
MRSKRFRVLAFTLEPRPRESAMHRQHWLNGREPGRESLFGSLANSGRTQDHLTVRRCRRASPIKRGSDQTVA